MIGIFDSGVGGFSVLRQLLRHSPQLSFVYVADTGHVPYSDKSPEELELLIRKILAFLLTKKVDQVVFACNTSSTLVLPKIRNEYPLPTFGVVEPAVKAALSATKGGGVGIVANNVTAKSGIFQRLIHEKNPNIEVIEKGCGALVPFVEACDLDSPKVIEMIRQTADELRGKIDTLIFGCTHFPFLQKHFEKFLPGVAMIDPALSLVDQVLPSSDKMSVAPHRQLLITKDSPSAAEFLKKMLNLEVPYEFLSLDSYAPWRSNIKEKSHT